MSLAITGVGWVTPLGNDLETVWKRLLNGEKGAIRSVSSPLGVDYPAMEALADQPPPHPRLRRSSAISRFAVVAGLAALADAGLKLDPEIAARTALVFAVANGGVIYTKRFYDQIVESGAQAASPLLFPETVFNAPASHLAAILGVTGVSYTLVGDGAVGILALKMAEDLMQDPTLDLCLVVGAEENDWLLCDSYRKWRLLRSPSPNKNMQHRRGIVLSEGAGAILLSRSGRIKIERIESGSNFRKQKEAGACVEKVFRELCKKRIDLVVASANGTFVDAAEQAAILRHCPDANVYKVKGALGESVGASSIWQTICGALAIRTQNLPLDTSGKENRQFRRVVISACGLNQQVTGLRLACTGD